MKTCNEWMAPDLARSWQLETAAQLSGDPISIPGPRLLARSWQLETAAQLSISAETLLKQFCSAYKQNLATNRDETKEKTNTKCLDK